MSIKEALARSIKELEYNRERGYSPDITTIGRIKSVVNTLTASAPPAAEPGYAAGFEACRKAAKATLIYPDDGSTAVPLEYVLIRGFSAMGWAQPSSAAHEICEQVADLFSPDGGEAKKSEGGTIVAPYNPCLAKLRKDEPFFVLLGRDKQAPTAVIAWADARERAEGKSEWTEQAREVAATMALYSGATLPSDPTANK